MDITQQKKLAAYRAAEEIESGMIVGLGTGSTVQFALEKIAEKLKTCELKNLQCIPSSINTEKEATRLGIPLITFDEALKIREVRNPPEERWASVKGETGNDNKKSEISSQNLELNAKDNFPFPILNSQFSIDLTIDGADEFDSELNLIKGGGGALLREKILAQASERLIIIADESKRSKYLGEKWPVPIEVIQMALPIEKNFLENLGASTKVRKTSEGNYFVTDEGNFIIDANFGTIQEVKNLSQKLNDRAGIVEHGIFVAMANKIICASSDGAVKEYCLEKK